MYRLIKEQREKCRNEPSILWPTATGCAHDTEATCLLRSWKNCLPGVCFLSIREQRTERSETILSDCTHDHLRSNMVMPLHLKKEKGKTSWVGASLSMNPAETKLRVSFPFRDVRVHALIVALIILPLSLREHFSLLKVLNCTKAMKFSKHSKSILNLSFFYFEY